MPTDEVVETTAAPTGVLVTVQLELVLTAASLAALRADPDAAEAGLAAGLAASLGVDSSAVTITRTVPSLRTRALAARRLQDVSLLVESAAATGAGARLLDGPLPPATLDPGFPRFTVAGASAADLVSALSGAPGEWKIAFSSILSAFI